MLGHSQEQGSCEDLPKDGDLQGPGMAVLSHCGSGAGLLPDISIEEKSHHTVMKERCVAWPPQVKNTSPLRKGG